MRAALLVVMVVLGAGMAQAQEQVGPVGKVLACRNIKGVTLKPSGGQLNAAPDGYKGFVLRFVFTQDKVLALWDEAYEGQYVEISEHHTLVKSKVGSLEWHYHFYETGIGVFTRYTRGERLASLSGVRVYWAQCEEEE